MKSKLVLKSTYLTRLVVGLSLLLVACKPSESATDATVRYEPGGVVVSVPSDWKSTRELNKLILSVPDSPLTMMFFAPAERGMEAGMAELDRLITHRRNGKVDMRSKAIADQMKIQNYYGTGEKEGRSVSWIMTLVDKNTFEEPRLAVLTIGPPEDLESKSNMVMEILTGLRRIQ